jgi:hypothetical protein
MFISFRILEYSICSNQYSCYFNSLYTVLSFLMWFILDTYLCSLNTYFFILDFYVIIYLVQWKKISFEKLIILKKNTFFFKEFEVIFFPMAALISSYCFTIFNEKKRLKGQFLREREFKLVTITSFFEHTYSKLYNLTIPRRWKNENVLQRIGGKHNGTKMSQ